MNTIDDLKILQALPLEVKIMKSKQRIKEWYNYWNGNVYVSISGGKFDNGKWVPYNGLGYKFVIDWINKHGNLNIKY